jgi:hypothetical protein
MLGILQTGWRSSRANRHSKLRRDTPFSEQRTDARQLVGVGLDHPILMRHPSRSSTTPNKEWGAETAGPSPLRRGQ